MSRIIAVANQKRWRRKNNNSYQFVCMSGRKEQKSINFRHGSSGEYNKWVRRRQKTRQKTPSTN